MAAHGHGYFLLVTLTILNALKDTGISGSIGRKSFQENTPKQKYFHVSETDPIAQVAAMCIVGAKTKVVAGASRRDVHVLLPLCVHLCWGKEGG